MSLFFTAEIKIILYKQIKIMTNNIKIERVLIKEEKRIVKNPKTSSSLIKRYLEDEIIPEEEEETYIEYVTPEHYEYIITSNNIKEWDYIEIEGIQFRMHNKGIIHQELKHTFFGNFSALNEIGRNIINKLYEKNIKQIQY